MKTEMTTYELERFKKGDPIILVEGERRFFPAPCLATTDALTHAAVALAFRSTPGLRSRPHV